MSIAIVWLRQDLRLTDNPALHYATQQHQQVILLYILEQDHNNPWPLGGAQQWWLHHSLTALGKAAHALGGQLVLRRGACVDELLAVIKESNAEAVYWNRCYEPHAIARDKALKAELIQQEIDVKSFNGSLLQEPWDVMNKQGGSYKVYTPYWRHCLHTMSTRSIYPAPPTLHNASHIKSEQLFEWNLLPHHPNWATGFTKYWQPGETGAQQQLEKFITERLTNYAEKRDFPSIAVTSHLSPHLHFGEISPWQVWHAIHAIMHDKTVNTQNFERFLAQLGWREFSYYLLYHFPKLPQENFRSEFNKFKWDHNEKALYLWQRGMTGYPIVDAGMRELWHSGIMHNRVRMIVASFLIKDLLLDWRLGEQWFWDTLVDADLANNAASWQWVAGSGADAAPYFRIFNPVLQSQKFDAQGHYIKHWVPELAKMPEKYLHAPWNAPTEILTAAEVTLGKDYPHPIVEHSAARDEAMLRYKKLKL